MHRLSALRQSPHLVALPDDVGCKVPARLTLADYHRRAQQTDQRRFLDPSFAFPLLGLFGETGSLLSEVKKKQRDSVAHTGYEAAILEELGDVLWYLVALADRAHITLGDLAVNLDSATTHWPETTSENLTFLAVDGLVEMPVPSPSPAFETTLIQLASDVGMLMADHSAGRLRQDHLALKRRLTAVLRRLRCAAHEAGTTLELAAAANINKISDRWPVHRTLPPLFDRDFPRHEQLPRSIVVQLSEIEKGGRRMAYLTQGGKPIGDPLTDNRAGDDDYRFHDVFHLAYAAYLGWSPTLRRMLKVKRKSDPVVDEIEDGARAILIEEGITTWIFNHAQQHGFLSGQTSLEYGLLKSVRRFVDGYEVETCPLWLWEEAILRGYEVFRSVRRHRGGIMIADLNERALYFEPT